MSSNFNSIVKKAMKSWECPELMNRATSDVGDKIPFSSPKLNWATYGGIPRNKFIEFYGHEGSGKTSSAVDICKNAIELFKEEYQETVDRYTELVESGKKEYKGPLEDLLDNGPKKILYVDLENSFDVRWAHTLGISKSDLLEEDSILKIMTPPNIAAEDIINTIMDMIETDELGLVVIDSLPMFVPRMELEKKVGERTVAALAGTLSVFLKKVVPMLTKHNCTMLAINQTRDNLENPYEPTRTPGGRTPKFLASLRLEFRLGKPVDRFGNELKKSVEDPDGYIINVRIVKQKSAPSDRKLGTYYLMTHSGIRPDFDYAKLAIEKYGFIKKAAGWFTMCDPYTGEFLEQDGKPVKENGIAKVYEYLKNNPEYYNKIKKYINDDLNKNDFDDDEDDTELDAITIEFEPKEVEEDAYMIEGVDLGN